jgi:hypothetical protein
MPGLALYMILRSSFLDVHLKLDWVLVGFLAHYGRVWAVLVMANEVACMWAIHKLIGLGLHCSNSSFP